MKFLGKHYRQNTAVLIYSIALLVLVLFIGFTFIDWSAALLPPYQCKDECLVKWFGALSGWFGAIITIAGAYWIAVKQLRPVLTQRRTEQRQEWIDRQKECAEVYTGISHAYEAIGEKGEFLIPMEGGTPSEHLVKRSYKEFSEDTKPRFDALHRQLRDTDLCMRKFTIYEDTGPRLGETRREYMEQAGTLVILATNLESIAGNIADSGTLTPPQLTEISKAVMVFYNSFRKMSETHSSFKGCLNVEQKRLERLITEKPKH